MFSKLRHTIVSGFDEVLNNHSGYETSIGRRRLEDTGLFSVKPLRGIIRKFHGFLVVGHLGSCLDGLAAYGSDS